MQTAQQIINNWINLKDISKPLDLNSLNLTELPTLPVNLKILYCSYNKLTTLPILPNTLIKLYCFNNQLTILPPLPNTLTVLICNNNKIKIINDIPKTIKQLNVDSYTIILNINELLEYKTINYFTFNEFYNQNIQKCFVNKTYLLNYKNINKWINNIEEYKDDDLLTFAYCISKTIKHISFVEFYDNVCKLGYKLNEFINNHNKIYFYVWIDNNSEV